MEKLKFYNPHVMSQYKLQDRGKNADSVYRENRTLILRLLQENKVISRGSLAEMSGLQLATVTIIMQQLLEAGIVVEAGLIDGTKGRRVKGFSIASDRYCMFSVRITSSYIKIGLYSGNGKNLFIRKDFFNTYENIEQTCRKISDIISEISESIKGRINLGVALGIEDACALVDNEYAFWDYQKREYVFVRRIIHDLTNLPVVVNRSINFATYSLWSSLNLTSLGCVVYIGIGYTVECGIVINGEILNGKDGLAGMIGQNFISAEIEDEIGGKIENKISAYSVLNKALNLIKDYPDSVLREKASNLNIRDIIKGYIEHDELCVLLYEEVAENIARIAYFIVNLLNPDAIFVGDEIPFSEEFESSIERKFESLTGNGNSNVVRITYCDAMKRLSQLDPALLGAAGYLFNLSIEMFSPLLPKDKAI